MGVIPFLIMEAFILALMIAFPSIATLLPTLMD
jgi:TRAP-type mannitol/chloroaromatic compound transport system permease large subunit